MEYTHEDARWFRNKHWKKRVWDPKLYPTVLCIQREFEAAETKHGKETS